MLIVLLNFNLLLLSILQTDWNSLNLLNSYKNTDKNNPLHY